MKYLYKKIIRVSIIVSILIGIAVAVLMMYIAWDHNASEEIHSDAVIHWGYWIEIGISWLISVSVSLFVILGIVPSLFVYVWEKIKM